jgi:hypothetical protein
MLHANFQDYPLQVHTKLTRQQAHKNSALLQHLPEASLTHFIEGLQLPPSRPALIEISVTKMINGQPVQRTIAMKIHVPPAGRALALQAIRETEDEEIVLHPKLALFGDPSPGLLKAHADLAYPTGVDEFVSTFDTAVALLFHHPGLINLSESENAKIPAYIIERVITRAIGMSNTLPYVLEELGENWATEKPVMEELADGKMEHMRDPENPKLFLYSREIHPDVMIEVEKALKEALIRVQQDSLLKGQQWDVQYGIGADSKKARAVKPGEQVKAGASKWALSNKTPGNGLTVSPVITVEPNTPGKGNYKGKGVWSNEVKYEKIKVLDAEMLDLLLKDKLLLRIAVPAHPGGVACIPVQVKQKGNDGPYIGSIDFKGEKGLSVKANFTLNSYKTGLDYTLDCTSIDNNASATLIVMQGDTQEVVKQLDFINIDGDTWVNYISIKCTNQWLRHLGAFVQFIDGDGKEIVVNKTWAEQLPEFLRAGFQSDPTKKYLDMLGPINLAFGIPVSDESITVRFPVHKDARTVRLLMGGLGTGEYDHGVCMPGLIMTVALELALPIFMLTAGSAIMNSKWVTDLMKDKAVLYSVIAIGLGLTGLDMKRTGDAEKPLLRLANVAGPMLLKTGLKTVIEKQVAVGMATKAIPIVGQAFQVLSAAVTLAQLGQTIAAVVQAPFVYRCDIVGTIDISITLTPDTEFHYFPLLANSYKVQVVYDKSATNLVYSGTHPGGTESNPITVRFSDAPAGGSLKVFVFFYAENGWQAGQAESNWFTAQGTHGTTLRIDNVEVKNNKIPLTEKSVYKHKQKLAIEKGKHVWVKDGPAPTATRESAKPDEQHELRDLTSITLAQRPASLGYTWQATGLHIPRDTNPDGPPTDDVLYMAQNISILSSPEDGYSTSKVGFSYAAGIAYDIATKDNGTGHNFFITSGSKDPNFHLRRLKLSYDGGQRKTIPPVFDHRTDESWGRFSTSLDRYVVHPQGYVFGISTNESKIYRVKLDKPCKESEAPFASLFSGRGKRDGLIDSPVAIAVGIDGVILVLEAKNNRVQAFDLNCNPVGSYFSNDGTKSCYLNLPDDDDVEYLDLAVEGKGYLYVLSCINGGKVVDDYSFTIHTPDGKKLVTTKGVAAAKLAVALDRSLYTLNYEVLFGKDKRTEPSVSLWLPAPPDPKS